jgi:hypothetical protein
VAPISAPSSDRGNLDFFCAVTIVGLLAGVAGLATTFVLRAVEHATYNYSFGALLAGWPPAARSAGSSAR